MNRDEIEKLLDEAANEHGDMRGVRKLRDAAPDLARTALDALTRLAAAEAQVGAMEKALTSIVESDDMAAELFTNDKDRADNHADRARAALASAAGGAK